MAVSIKGKFKDLIGWKNLPGLRTKWIDAASPVVGMPDYTKDLGHKLHPERVYGVITEIKDETSSAKTFRIARAPGTKNELPNFRAGMYISVRLSINGNVVTRPYAISSSPKDATKKHFFEITVKKVNGGFVSEYIWENWHMGTFVEFDGPHGFLYYSPIRDSKKIVCIAGGSGITPFRSIIRDIIENNLDIHLDLLYGSRDEEDIIFNRELTKLAVNSGGKVNVCHILSEPKDGWNGERGFITAETITRLTGAAAEHHFFLCGPQVLYNFANAELDKLNVPVSHRREEAYGESADITKHPKFPRDKIGKSFKISVMYGVEVVEISGLSTDTVLVSLEKAGLAPESRCRSGECGWCRSRLVKGTVWTRPEGDGTREADCYFDYFHPCSSYPTSNIVMGVYQPNIE